MRYVKMYTAKRNIGFIFFIIVLYTATISFAKDKVVVVPLFDNNSIPTSDLQNRVLELEKKVAQLQALLDGVIRDGNTIQFSGVNVQIVNGRDETGGTVNGLGNLIVGYNEESSQDNDRTGSHNLIVGRYNNYSSYGGLVVGSGNTISGIFASISGGTDNVAKGHYSSMSGGYKNFAEGNWSSVSGGDYNHAKGLSARVSGGKNNKAEGDYSSVSGGYYNSAAEEYTSVSGGGFNQANGEGCSVSGGYKNSATNSYSSVSGGSNNSASGSMSSLSGGRNRSVTGQYDWRAGGSLFQDD